MKIESHSRWIHRVAIVSGDTVAKYVFLRDMQEARLLAAKNNNLPICSMAMPSTEAQVERMLLAWASHPNNE